MTDNDHMSRSQKKAEKEFLEAFALALKDGNTRVVLRWIIDQCGVFDTSFTGNSTTFYNEGRRSVALDVIGMMNAVDPYEVVRLMKDGADDVVTRRNEARNGQ